MVRPVADTVQTMVSTYQDRLEEAMRDESVDIAALAKTLGVSYQAVKKVLVGKTKSFSARNNEIAARRLRRRSFWLATGTGPKFPNDSAAVDDPCDAVVLLRERLSLLSASDRRAVAALVASYVGDEDASEHQLEAIRRLLGGPRPRRSARPEYDSDITGAIGSPPEDGYAGGDPTRKPAGRRK